MNQPNSREESIFLAALALPPADRAAYLDRACPDAALRARVDNLLAVQSSAEALCDPAGPESDAEATQAQVRSATESLTPTEKPGDLIGPYKLREQIGEGGCGTVYVAEQEKPIRRQVALKVIKLGMDTKSVIARFEAERQALAMMDHPNIAKVLDAGATNAGRPFFVMELVHGIRITDYCDQANLSTKERLDLFTAVCSAIQHAHQKGIIHRDIKPSNILVTLHDGVPVPKVIDFGIAKATEGRLNDSTQFTELHQFIGTPAYASPEQAAASGVDVDTRADIYSLGVVLYELLTGRLPFDPKALVEAGLEAMRRMLREVEPPKPSARLTTLTSTDRTAIAKQRATEAAHLTTLLRGDLDWIVMKALEKDRTRRYESASAFAQDIRRYLGHEAVLACPPSAAYRFQKLVRRHRLAFAAGAAVAASLVIGLSVSTWLFFKEKAAREQAVEAKTQTQQALGEAKQQRTTAVAERGKALIERDRADAEADRAGRQLYIAHMNLAKRAWDEAHVSRVVELLDLHRPQANRPDLRGFEWYYLQRLCHLDLLTLKGHPSGVTSVAFSADGKRLASASTDQTVKVWDAATGRATFTLKGHTREVTSVAFSADGKRLASAGGDQTVKVWDATSGQAMLTWKMHTDVVRSVAFSADGKRLASASDDQTVKVWDTTSGQATLTLKGHAHWVRSVAFSADGKRLASASADGTVKVWAATNGQEMLTLKGHTGGRGVWGVAFSADGKQLASANEDGTVKVWDATSGQETLTLKGHSDAARSVAFSADGKRLASASWDRTVKVWDATSSQETLTLKGHASVGNGVTFSGDGKWLASARQDWTVKVCDATSGKETLTLKGHTREVMSVAFSADGKRLASASWDRTVKVWDATSGQETLTLNGHTGPVFSVAFSVDGKRLASASEDGTVKVWDATSGQATLTLNGHTGAVYSVAFSADGKRLASASADKTAKVWDTTSGQATLTLNGHLNQVLGVAFSADGKQLASASWDRTLKVWDTTSGQETLTLKGHTHLVRSVAFSADGKRLASASWDQTVTVWDATSGQEMLTLKGHTAAVNSVAFSPDGKRLASASHDGTVKVWDATPIKEVAR